MKVLFIILKKKYFFLKKNTFLFFKYFKKQFLHGHKESFQWKKTLYSTSNVAMLGDFNAGIDTQFEIELRELCSNQDLVVSDSEFYGCTSGMFIHVSNAHGSTSLLDHVICNRDILQYYSILQYYNPCCKYLTCMYRNDIDVVDDVVKC